MDESPIVRIDNERIINCVFERIASDKEMLELQMKQLAREFLRKYPAFKIESIAVFDVYCDQRCIVTLQLK